ncbi:hypothetical protein ACOSQ2_001243 [Xanthoceras sorbifolium]
MASRRSSSLPRFGVFLAESITSQETYSVTAPVVDDIWGFLSQLGDCSCSFISRSGNHVGHLLAKHALSISSDRSGLILVILFCLLF